MAEHDTDRLADIEEQFKSAVIRGAFGEFPTLLDSVFETRSGFIQEFGRVLRLHGDPPGTFRELVTDYPDVGVPREETIGVRSWYGHFVDETEKLAHTAITSVFSTDLLKGLSPYLKVGTALAAIDMGRTVNYLHPNQEAYPSREDFEREVARFAWGLERFERIVNNLGGQTLTCATSASVPYGYVVSGFVAGDQSTEVGISAYDDRPIMVVHTMGEALRLSSYQTTPEPSQDLQVPALTASTIGLEGTIPPVSFFRLPEVFPINSDVVAVGGREDMGDHPFALGGVDSEETGQLGVDRYLRVKCTLGALAKKSMKQLPLSSSEASGVLR